MRSNKPNPAPCYARSVSTAGAWPRAEPRPTDVTYGSASASAAGSLKEMAGLLYPLSGGAVGVDSSLSLLEGTIPRDALPVERPRASGKDEEEENDENLPMVFLCGGCKRPVGDTLSWVANDEETECILLRSECRSHGLSRTAAVGGPWSTLPLHRCLQQRLGGQGAEAVQEAWRVWMVSALNTTVDEIYVYIYIFNKGGEEWFFSLCSLYCCFFCFF